MRISAALARFQTQLQADGRSPHTLFALLLGTGARLGPTLAIDVGDVDLAGPGTVTS